MGGPRLVDVTGRAAEMGLQLFSYRVGLLRVSSHFGTLGLYPRNPIQSVWIQTEPTAIRFSSKKVLRVLV